MYLDIKTCVSNGGNTSPFFKTTCGIRQGENLSPILFSLYLNYLENYLSQSSTGVEINVDIDNTVLLLKLLVLLYADDTIVLSDNETDFQNALNDFYAYCKKMEIKNKLHEN